MENVLPDAWTPGRLDVRMSGRSDVRAVGCSGSRTAGRPGDRLLQGARPVVFST